MKTRSILSILKFFELLANARVAYNNAKKDEETRKTVTKFGGRAIVYTIVYVLLVGCGVALFYFGITNIASSLILVSIIAILASVYMLLWGVPYLILAINLTIKQLILNRKFIGWLALILLVIVISLTVAVVIIGVRM